MENDRRRSQRQLVSPLADESEALLDSCGQVLLPPGEDPIVPMIPSTFPWNHRPRLWYEFPRLDFPKREREGDETSFDLGVSSRPPKRLASGKSASDTELAAPSDCSRRDETKPAPIQSQLQLVPAPAVSEYGT